MITPTIASVQVTAKVSAADLTTLMSIITASGVLGELPAGKTLADVAGLNLQVLPAAQPDGTVAVLNAAIK